MNVIEEYYLILVSYIQKFGWYILAVLIIYYFSKPQIKEFQAKMSLRSANDPKRVSVLDQQRNKIREKQQKELEQLAGNKHQ